MLTATLVPATNSYDDVPYGSYPFPQTHPDRLATIATLLGMRPAPIDGCRVLELGCASGGNLIPSAERFPGSRFLGVDSSHSQIAAGAALVTQIGLSNIELRHANLLEFDSHEGPFDYIMAHGVYSWVPHQVREKILDICSRNLAPAGVAYVSYNAYPGWRMRGMIRDMMWYRVRGFQQPEDRIRQARALLDFLVEAVPTQNDAYALLLQNELKVLHGRDDYYLFHEHLEDVNDPFYFHEFIARAGAHRLQYLGEAEFRFMPASNFPPHVEAGLRRVASNLIEMEQYMDFVRNRTFRQTLLCHADLVLDRSLSPNHVHSLHVATSSRPENPPIDLHAPGFVKFVGPSAVLNTNDNLVKAAMLHVGEIWPGSIPFSELVEAARARLKSQPTAIEVGVGGADARALAEAMVRGYGTGQIELSTAACSYTLDITERPRISALGRYQAAQGGMVTNQRHESVALNDLQRRIVRCLDGNRRRDDIVAHLAGLVARGAIQIHNQNRPVYDEARVHEILEQELEAQLPILARHALLLRGAAAG